MSFSSLPAVLVQLIMQASSRDAHMLVSIPVSCMTSSSMKITSCASKLELAIDIDIARGSMQLHARAH